MASSLGRTPACASPADLFAAISSKGLSDFCMELLAALHDMLECPWGVNCSSGVSTLPNDLMSGCRGPTSPLEAGRLCLGEHPNTVALLLCWVRPMKWKRKNFSLKSLWLLSAML